MLTVYNPLTGEWERVDDLERPYPVISRDTRLIAVNTTVSFVPTLASGNWSGHTDMFGIPGLERANIGIPASGIDVDFVIPDPWRIRRMIVVGNRTATGTTNVAITCTVVGRLIASDGTPTNWRTVATFTDASFANDGAMRFALPTSLFGVFGYDQYRIVFRRDPNSDPAPVLSQIRVYAEF